MYLEVININNLRTENLLATLLLASFTCAHNALRLLVTERDHSLCPQLTCMKIQKRDINYTKVSDKKIFDLSATVGCKICRGSSKQMERSVW